LLGRKDVFELSQIFSSRLKKGRGAVFVGGKKKKRDEILDVDQRG